MVKRPEIEYGPYVRFSIREDRLRIFLLPQGRQLLRDARGENKRSDLDMFLDLIDYHMCNGWTIVRPELVGDMRDDAWLVVSRDYVWADPDQDEALIVGTAYSFLDYWREGYTESLVRRGYVDFARHDYLTSQEVDFEVARCRPDYFVGAEGERERLLTAAESYYAFREAESAGQLALNL